MANKHIYRGAMLNEKKTTDRGMENHINNFG
jgi:hypothetical protein